MKKTIIISAMFLAALTLAGIAGAKAKEEKPKPKFPYVSEELNKPCGKTMFEWRCIENSFEPKRLKLNREFDVIALVATPSKDMLTVKVNVTRRPRIKLKPGTRQWNRIIEVSTRYALRMARKRFGDNKAFEDWHNFKMEFYVDEKLAATRDFDGIKIK